jgi:hypothetical protein
MSKEVKWVIVTSIDLLSKFQPNKINNEIFVLPRPNLSTILHSNKVLMIVSLACKGWREEGNSKDFGMLFL